MADEERDALEGDSDVTSGTETPNPVNAPTTKEDEGNEGDGTGEGAVTDGATDTNPNVGEPDL